MDYSHIIMWPVRSFFHYNLSFANCESWLVKNSAPRSCKPVLCCCDCIFNFKVDKRIACRIGVGWLGQCFCFARFECVSPPVDALKHTHLIQTADLCFQYIYEKIICLIVIVFCSCCYCFMIYKKALRALNYKMYCWMSFCLLTCTSKNL